MQWNEFCEKAKEMGCLYGYEFFIYKDVYYFYSNGSIDLKIHCNFCWGDDYYSIATHRTADQMLAIMKALQ